MAVCIWCSYFVLDFVIIPVLCVLGVNFANVWFLFLKVPGGWHFDGQKCWIGNNTFADMLIILARYAYTNQLNG